MKTIINKLVMSIICLCIPCLSAQDADYRRIELDLTPLMRASMIGDIQQAEAVVKAGVALDAQDHHGKTALMHAVTRNQLPMVVWLVEHGVNLNLQDEKGDSAYAIACHLNLAEIAEYLEAVLLHPNAINAVKHPQALDVQLKEKMLDSIKSDSDSLVIYDKHLTICGDKEHAQNVRAALLCSAVYGNKPYSVSYLLDLYPGLYKGQSISLKRDVGDGEGHEYGSLLHYAVLHNYISIAQILLDHGADPSDKTDYCRSPYRDAHDCARTSSMKKLLGNYVKKHHDEL